jgi:hypothetical protein
MCSNERLEQESVEGGGGSRCNTPNGQAGVYVWVRNLDSATDGRVACGLLMDVQGPLGNALTAGSHDRPEDFYPRACVYTRQFQGKGSTRRTWSRVGRGSEIERPLPVGYISEHC